MTTLRTLYSWLTSYLLPMKSSYLTCPGRRFLGCHLQGDEGVGEGVSLFVLNQEFG